MARRRKVRQWSADRTRNRELAEMVTKAIDEIAGMNGQLSGGFVKVRTIMSRRQYDPTAHQAELLRWIRRQGWVPEEVTLGMHYGFLGGLMARGLVRHENRDGKEGVAAI